MKKKSIYMDHFAIYQIALYDDVLKIKYTSKICNGIWKSGRHWLELFAVMPEAEAKLERTKGVDR